MKKMFIVILLFFNIIYINSLINNKNLFDFIEEYKNKEYINNKDYYLWSGTIINIEKNNDITNVHLIKAKWVSKQQLIYYNIILQTNDPILIEKINSLNLYQNVIFITEVLKIENNNTIICLPLLINEN